MYTPWATGVAEVVSQTSRAIVVRCCHCGQTHPHGRQMLGSKAAVAGCHIGRDRCRQYSIPDVSTQYRAPRAQVDVVAAREHRRGARA